MKIKIVLSLIMASSMLFTPTVFANENVQDDQTVEQTPEEPTEELPSVSTQTYPEGMEQDQPGAWAVLDSNGNVTNLISCTPAVCGSGTFGGSNVVFQSHANSQGNAVGNTNTQYDPANNVWTDTRPSGSVYVVSTDYPESYNYKPENYLTCISNCENDEFEEPVTEEPVPDPVPEEKQEEEVSTIIVSRLLANGNLVFKSDTFSVNKKIKIVATKKINGKVRNVSWTRTVKEGSLVVFSVPKKFRSWNISVKYMGKTVEKIKIKNNSLIRIEL
jgi:hypothetical protein